MARAGVQEVQLLTDSVIAVLRLFLGPDCSRVSSQHGAIRLNEAKLGYRRIISQTWYAHRCAPGKPTSSLSLRTIKPRLKFNHN